MNEETSATGFERVLGNAATSWRSWALFSRPDRARVLRQVADAVDSHSDELVEIAQKETHLPEARLRSEIVRTTFQVRLFADLIEDGGYLDARIDHADAEWGMGPRPDLRRVLQPIGPVLVFTASNFPFAFSVIGGDSVSALAAGCSVVVKAHPGHPRLSERTAAIVIEALTAAGAPIGVFGHLSGMESGRRAIVDPRIRAASFTGSISGGRALFDLASRRDVPIPFFGELGSVNPVFVTRGADTRSDEITRGFIESFTLGSGQFCTKPGLLIVPEEGAIIAALRDSTLPEVGALLTGRIDSAFRAASIELDGSPEVNGLSRGSTSGREPTASLYATSVEALLANFDALAQERFGPTALVATYRDENDLLRVAHRLPGQLTATVYGDLDEAIIPALVEALGDRAGRLLWNQWPTGVSVTYAQQHGGPYPATTAVGATSVGTGAIARFLRPLAFQGFPEMLLPEPLRESSRVPRVVDGRPVL